MSPEKRKENKQIRNLLKIWNEAFEGSFSLKQKVSIRKFLSDLDFEEVEEAMEIAVCHDNIIQYRDVWAYFCGICWNKIKGGY